MRRPAGMAGSPVRVVEDLSLRPTSILSVRRGLGRQPSLQSVEARELRVPILVIKSDTLPQVERARRTPGLRSPRVRHRTLDAVTPPAWIRGPG